jgi:hypothetical protein
MMVILGIGITSIQNKKELYIVARFYMKCPFCGGEMVLGHIQPIGLRSAFWLPDNVGIKNLGPGFLTVDKIKHVGGHIIGEATNFGVLSTSLTDSLLCQKCSLLITKLKNQ